MKGMNNIEHRDGEVIVCLPSKHEALSSIPSTSKKKKKRERKLPNTIFNNYGTFTNRNPYKLKVEM
jgi:hypothetical protein